MKNRYLKINDLSGGSTNDLLIKSSTQNLDTQWKSFGALLKKAIIDAPVFANDLEAASLLPYTFYKTPTGELRYKVGAVSIQVNFIGDSLTAAVGTSDNSFGYGQQSINVLQNLENVTGRFEGYPGQTARWYIENKLSDFLASLDSSKAYVSVVFFGANDLCQDQSVTDDFYSSIPTICSALKSAGHYVLVIPVLSRKDNYAQSIGYANITRRNAFNNWLDANYNSFCDGIIDRSLAPEIYSDNAPDSCFYYREDDIDGLSKVHLTDFGAFSLSKIVAKKITEILGIDGYSFNPITTSTGLGWGNLIDVSVEGSAIIKSPNTGTNWNAAALWNKKIKRNGTGLQATITIDDISLDKEVSQLLGVSKKIGSFGYQYLERAFYWDNNADGTNAQYTIYEDGNTLITATPVDQPYDLKIEVYHDSVKYYVDNELKKTSDFTFDTEFAYITAVFFIPDGSEVRNVSVGGNIIDY